MTTITSRDSETKNGIEYDVTRFADGSVMRTIKLGGEAVATGAVGDKAASLESVMVELRDIRSALEKAGVMQAKEEG